MIDETSHVPVEPDNFSLSGRWWFSPPVSLTFLHSRRVHVRAHIFQLREREIASSYQSRVGECSRKNNLTGYTPPTLFSCPSKNTPVILPLRIHGISLRFVQPDDNSAMERDA